MKDKNAGETGAFFSYMGKRVQYIFSYLQKKQIFFIQEMFPVVKNAE